MQGAAQAAPRALASEAERAPLPSQRFAGSGGDDVRPHEGRARIEPDVRRPLHKLALPEPRILERVCTERGAQRIWRRSAEH